MSEFGSNVPPTTRSYKDGDLDLKSHSKDRRSGLSILGPQRVVHIHYTKAASRRGLEWCKRIFDESKYNLKPRTQVVKLSSRYPGSAIFIDVSSSVD